MNSWLSMCHWCGGTNDNRPATMTLLLWVPVRKIAFLTEPIPVLDGPADHTNVNSITIDPTPTNGSLSSDATNPNPAGLASLLPSIIKEKLKNFQPASQLPLSQQPLPAHSTISTPCKPELRSQSFSTNPVLPLVLFHPHLSSQASLTLSTHVPLKIQAGSTAGWVLWVWLTTAREL